MHRSLYTNIFELPELVFGWLVISVRLILINSLKFAASFMHQECQKWFFIHHSGRSSGRPNYELSLSQLLHPHRGCLTSHFIQVFSVYF